MASERYVFCYGDLNVSWCLTPSRMGLCFTTIFLIKWEMRFLQKYTNMKFMNLTGEWQKPNLGPGAGGVIPGNSWWGCADRFFKSWPYFRPKNVIFHTRFQTRPLKSIPVFTPSSKAEIMSSLFKLERKQNNSSNAFRNRIFPFRAYSFGIWNDKYVHTLT